MQFRPVSKTLGGAGHTRQTAQTRSTAIRKLQVNVRINVRVCHLVSRATRRNEAPTRAIAGARTVTMATVRPNPPAHLLVLGIVMSEKTYTSRIRWLRAYYSDPLVNSGSAVLVRFVIEANWWARRIVEVPSSASDDVLGVVTMSDLPQRHCAHKMVGWWRAAARWPAAFYGKTDDDAAIDLPRLVPLLMQSLPRTRVFAGVVRYSSINESDWQGVCWAPGAGGALKLRRRDPACAASHVYGPFPFVEGPLVLMSADVQSWLAPKLAIDRRQLCHFGDLLLGRELSHHPALELINLDRLIGRSNVIAGRAQGGGWVGATGLLAHWVRTEKNFRRAVVEFQRTAQQQQLWKGGDAQRTVAPASNLTLECSLWRSSYADLAFYPCCQNWTLCVPPRQSKRQSRRDDKRRRASFTTDHKSN